MEKRYSGQPIICISREAETPVPARAVCRKHAISDATFCTRHRKFGARKVPKVK